MPTATNTHTPTRRSALQFSVAAFAVGLTAPALASVNPDAELLAACTAFLASDARLKALAAGDLSLTDGECGAELDRWCVAMERVTAISPRTPEGQRAKLRVGHAALASTAVNDRTELQPEEQCALSALACILGRVA